MNKIRSKLPQIQEIIPVLSVIMFFNFSWSIGRMFWFMPSWLFFMTLGEILPITAYVLAFALFESLLILCLLLVLALLLPARYFQEKFIAQGSLIALILTAATITLHLTIGFAYGWSRWEIAVYMSLVAIAILSVAMIISYVLTHHVAVIEKLVISIADRMMVFFYLYLPLGMLGLVAVIIRNIF